MAGFFLARQTAKLMTMPFPQVGPDALPALKVHGSIRLKSLAEILELRLAKRQIPLAAITRGIPCKSAFTRTSLQSSNPDSAAGFSSPSVPAGRSFARPRCSPDLS